MSEFDDKSLFYCIEKSLANLMIFFFICIELIAIFHQIVRNYSPYLLEHCELGKAMDPIGPSK